jgi:hypothetical protein
MSAASPSGFVVFASDSRDYNHEIYAMRPDGQQVTRITYSQADDRGPRVTPDGSRIIFFSNRDGEQTGGYELYSVNIDGSGLKRLTTGFVGTGYSDAFQSDISPDGTKIVTVRERRIAVVDLTTGAITDLTGLAPNNGQYLYPSWRPDGQKIAFVERRFTSGGFEAAEVYLMNPDGSGITTYIENAKYLRFSPDGTRILYHDVHSGFAINDAGNTGEPRYLVNPTLYITDAEWTADSASIIFSDDAQGAGSRPGLREIYRVDVNRPASLVRLTHNRVSDREASAAGGSMPSVAVAPTAGGEIAFSGTRVGYRTSGEFIGQPINVNGLFVMNGGGWHVRLVKQLTTPGTDENGALVTTFRESPQFSKDGQRLTYFAFDERRPGGGTPIRSDYRIAIESPLGLTGVIPTSEHTRNPALNFNGSKVVWDNGTELLVANGDGSGARTISAAIPGHSEPDWSPAAGDDRITYRWYQAGGTLQGARGVSVYSTIGIIPARQQPEQPYGSGSELERRDQSLTPYCQFPPDGRNVEFGHPIWTAGEPRVVYFRNTELQGTSSAYFSNGCAGELRHEIVSTPVSGGAPTVVYADIVRATTAEQPTPPRLTFAALAGSPDGATLAAQTGSSRIYTISMADGSVRQLTFGSNLGIQTPSALASWSAAVAFSLPRASYTILGAVIAPDGSARSGVVVQLSGSMARTATTGSDGSFSFTDLPEGGDFTISVEGDAYVQSSRTYTNLGANHADATFQQLAPVEVTPTPTPSPSPTASPTPSATPVPGRALNIATRMRVQSGDNVLIAGFIVQGESGSTKRIILRGIGPSLGQAGLGGALADPILDLYDSEGEIIVSNNNWRTGQRDEVEATGIPPAHELEPAIVATLAPGLYTAVLRGNLDGTGIGLVEAYDLDQQSPAQFANIATRGKVETGDDVMIGGFIVGGETSSRMLIRAIGPSLSKVGVPGVLEDPVLELYNANGLVMANDDWRTAQADELTRTNAAPSDERESALLVNLSPGGYTAVVRGKNETTGVAVVEVYNLGPQ